MVRFTAGRPGWGTPAPVELQASEIDQLSSKHRTKQLPAKFQQPMDKVDGVAAWQMSVWMTKHGKARLIRVLGHSSVPVAHAC